MNPYSYDVQALERKARAVRRHIVRLNANSPAGGHTGADLSQVELLTALYFRILNVAPERLLTTSAISTSSRKAMRWAATTACWPRRASSRLSGWKPISMPTPIFPVTRCARKRRALSSTPARWATVCLLRWGWRWLRKKQQHPPHLLITGDGELAEGSNWEAALAAAHYGLDNLIIINDKNNLQLAGPTREIMNTDPLADKWKAFGMTVTECQGNDMASVVATLEGLKQEGKPNVVIANTTKGAGISFIQGRPEWHHRVPKGEEIALALEELKDE
jgi:transketolase